jgi:hypothetical protein
VSRTSIPLLVLAIVSVTALPGSADARAYSIPVYGRFSTPIIGLEIPSTPKWGHDVVLNASLVWNRAQVWYQQTHFPTGSVYTFVESDNGNATIAFNLPRAYVGIALGWTDYTFAPSSSMILSTRVFLDPKIFNAAQEENSTARQLAFRLALHELGRVFGLGSVLDGVNIMDPIETAARATEPPMVSSLELYALHVLASKTPLTSPFIVLNTDHYQLLDAWTFLADTTSTPTILNSGLPPGGNSSLPSLTPSSDLQKVNEPRDQAKSGQLYVSSIAIALVLSSSSTVIALGRPLLRHLRRAKQRLRKSQTPPEPQKAESECSIATENETLAATLSISVAQLQDKQARLQAAIDNNENTIHQLNRTLELGYDLESLREIENRTRTLGGLGNFLKALAKYDTLAQLEEEVTNTRTFQDALKKERSRLEAENIQHKEEIDIMRKLMNDHKLNLEGLQELLQLCVTYGAPDKIFKAIRAFGNLKTLENNVTSKANQPADLNERGRELTTRSSHDTSRIEKELQNTQASSASDVDRTRAQLKKDLEGLIVVGDLAQAIRLLRTSKSQ